MVPDPYKALGLSHDASATEIKKSYRKLAMQYHPDRLVARNASAFEFRIASERFAAISAAYQLLSDESRKRQYDHVYKFGGYDEDPVEKRIPPPHHQPFQSNTQPFSRTSPTPDKSKQVGIGYAISDPLSYLFPKLSKCGGKAVAGIQIPSRVHLVHPPPGGGLRFAYSSGEFTTCQKSGAKKFVSKTTQFVQGKKYSRVETTTVHPDGRREIVIEGNDYIKRRWTTPPRKKVRPDAPDVSRSEPDDMTSVHPGNESDEPWYVSAWNGIRKGFTMCHNPCGGEILAQ